MWDRTIQPTIALSLEPPLPDKRGFNLSKHLSQTSPFRFLFNPSLLPFSLAYHTVLVSRLSEHAGNGFHQVFPGEIVHSWEWRRFRCGI